MASGYEQCMNYAEGLHFSAFHLLMKLPTDASGGLLSKYYLGSVALHASGRCCSQHTLPCMASGTVPGPTRYSGQEGARGKVSQRAGERHSSSELQAALVASPPGESDLALHGQEPSQVSRDVKHLK